MRADTCRHVDKGVGVGMVASDVRDVSDAAGVAGGAALFATWAGAARQRRLGHLGSCQQIRQRAAHRRCLPDAG